MSGRILVVDDEKLIRWAIRERLSMEGYEIEEAENGATATALVQNGPFDAALLDLRLPDADGMDLLKQFRQAAPDMAIIIITAFSSVDSAVEAMKEGAYYYITKPFNMDELVITINRALETKTLKRRVTHEVNERKAQYGLSEIIGETKAIVEIKELVLKIAQGDATTVLLLGESGTGKDMIARAIHYESARAENLFMNVTSTALPEALLESELFGHEKGAFTDAREQKKGLFELADGGTVFLDEVGDMSPAIQAKLLRVLEERTFRRVGGTQDITVDIRVIGATNVDIETALRDGAFREDLYYRLSTVPIYIPPLRERKDDVSLLADHFRRSFAKEFRREMAPLSNDVVDKLKSYSWPGNVRELRNVMERAALLSSGSELEAGDIVLGRASFKKSAGDTVGDFRLPEEGCDLEDVEKALLLQALERVDWNQSRVGKLLGLSRDQVRYKMSKHKLERP